MASTIELRDQFGIVHEACKILPSDEFKLKFLDSLAELEDENCHKNKTFPKTRLHKIQGIKKAIYRADIDKISGWRFHCQYDKSTKQFILKDIICGQKHDDVQKIIKSKNKKYD